MAVAVAVAVGPRGAAATVVALPGGDAWSAGAAVTGAAVTGAALSVGAAATTVGASGIGAGAGLLEFPLVQPTADNTSNTREEGRRIGKVLSTATGRGKRL